MKPIEPGCLAMVINSSAGNNGKVVTVVRYFGEELYESPDGSIRFHRTWRIDKPMKTFSGRLQTAAAEYQLLRIDGYEEPEEVLQEAEA